ncbi:U3 small nucleolar RNA-associated protein 7, putative (UTP7) [Plasmodium ovale wallikeri]|uniref:U3 small nucleolar RNA-associated protein 7, putative (UTP7) n=1 Tax=Plasmodium ovale wallikeri TaxID=864142 RepID=A0A1A8YK85_PLAOA|nr:U3 small nucleolar RNA-associated protein 7, putative (UTP7) [Plasmodium ovale wallikeri]
MEEDERNKDKDNRDRNKVVKGIRERIRKKEDLGIGLVSSCPLADVKGGVPVENLPNCKNIRKVQIKRKIGKDVKLAILSSKKMAAHSKLQFESEGYIRYRDKETERKSVMLGGKKGKLPLGEDAHKGKLPLGEDAHKGKLPLGEDSNKGKFPLGEDANMNDYLPCDLDIEEQYEGVRRKRLSQKEIYERADVGTKKKVFDLSLNLGPYKCTYSRNGKYLLSTGNKGHITLIDAQNLEPMCELEVDETVRCNTILHNHKLFAVGQKRYMYIYDNTGMEVNCIKDILYTYQMEFLPYHFLLVSIGEFGELVYQDISIGKIITRKKTKRGSCFIMKHNKNNGLIYLGHKNGHVTLWSPNVDSSVCDIFCHYTPISAIGVQDNYLVTASVDCTYKLWDLRKLEYIKSYRAHNIINNIEVSDTSLVAFTMNSHFRTYRNFFTKPELYLTHNTYGEKIHSIAFQPFEDVCCAGLGNSIKSFLIPGAGLANIDTFVNNPYETKKQVRENEVRQLLEKLPPETIHFKKDEIGKINPYMVKENYVGDDNKRYFDRKMTQNLRKKKQVRDNTKMSNTCTGGSMTNQESALSAERGNDVESDIDSESGNFTEKHTHSKTITDSSKDQTTMERKKKKKKKKKKKNSLLNPNVPKYMRKSLKDRLKEEGVGNGSP